jgi:two-component system, NarL family, nitrate/nitrite response regulator NarL
MYSGSGLVLVSGRGEILPPTAGASGEGGDGASGDKGGNRDGAAVAAVHPDPAAAVRAVEMRLILGDGQAIFLDALASVLAQHGYEVGAVARSPEELIAQVRHQRPDACLIDCDLTSDNGIETIRRVLEVSAATTVIVLGASPEAELADQAMDAGASGYLHQSRGVEVLVAALERILNGERIIDLPDAPARRAEGRSRAAVLAASLTARERECLSLLVAGLDTAAMVHRLGVSRTTVRTHLQSVLTKLCVHSRLEAASFAVRHRLVDAWADPATGTPAAAMALAGTGTAPTTSNARPNRAWRQPPIHAVGESPRPAWRPSPELAASG